MAHSVEISVSFSCIIFPSDNSPSVPRKTRSLSSVRLLRGGLTVCWISSQPRVASCLGTSLQWGTCFVHCGGRETGAGLPPAGRDSKTHTHSSRHTRYPAERIAASSRWISPCGHLVRCCVFMWRVSGRRSWSVSVKQGNRRSNLSPLRTQQQQWTAFPRRTHTWSRALHAHGIVAFLTQSTFVCWFVKRCLLCSWSPWCLRGTGTTWWMMWRTPGCHFTMRRLINTGFVSKLRWNKTTFPSNVDTFKSHRI